MPRAAIINGGGRVVNVIEADWRTAIAPAGHTVVDATDPAAGVGGRFIQQGRKFERPKIAAVVDPATRIVKDVLFADAATATPPQGMVLVDASQVRTITEWWRLDAGTNQLRPPTTEEDAADELIRIATAPIVIAG